MNTDQKTGAQLGFDVGGTFVDVVLRLDDGREDSEKLLADVDKLTGTIENSIARLLERNSISGNAVNKVVHATTRGSNAVLERKGPEVALLTTRGFRDVLQIGRALRWSMYDVQLDKPVPLVPRSRSFEVIERCLADGSVRTELAEDELVNIAATLRERNIRDVAVSFMHSYIAPQHERRAREVLLEAWPELEVTLSSDVSQQGREYERSSTAVVNAYLIPVLGSYLRELAEMLPRLQISAPLWVMQSSGGLVSAEQAARMPVRTLESGPAAGVLASTHFGAQCGYDDVLSLDMGGTTAKVAIVEKGVANKTSVFELERIQNRRGSGLPVDISAIDLVEIGTGGGSIAEARLDVLQVGPESSSAYPGPACYGRGGVKSTVTDANLLLGYLNPAQFAGGSMTLDVAAAKQAMDKLASDLKLDRQRTAWGVHEMANLEMESALRLVSIDRGFDPRSFAMVCIGGAAATHGSRLARALGIETMIVPPGAGVGSAIGLLQAKESIELSQSQGLRLDDDNASEQANSILKKLEQNARDSISGAWPEAEIRVIRSVGLRYVGQGYELKVNLDASEAVDAGQLSEDFHQRYEKNYGYRDDDLIVEAVTWYLSLYREQAVAQTTSKEFENTSGQQANTRKVYFGETGELDASVVQRHQLSPGSTLGGPCIIEEDYTTTVILAGDELRVAENGALVIEIGAGS